MIASLLDLDTDCLRTIAALLSPRDACSLARTCSRLAEQVSKDENAWRCCGERLTCPDIDVLTVRRHLRLRSYKAFCQVTHQMRGCPLGFWRRLDSCSDPYGELILVRIANEKLEGRVLLPTGDISETVFTIAMATHASQPSLTQAKVANYAGRPAEVKLFGNLMNLTSDSLPASFWKEHGGFVPREGLAEAEDEVFAVPGGQGLPDGIGHGGAHTAGNQAGQLVPGFPAAAVQPSALDDQSSDQAVGVGPLVWDHTRQAWRRILCNLPTRRQVQRFERLPQQQTALHGNFLAPSMTAYSLPNVERPMISIATDSLQFLSRLQGYWSACYGPHGVEIVRVELISSSHPDADQCPFGDNCRLVARKLTGDCNVPAGQITLCTVDTTPLKLGRYLGFEEDAQGQLLPDRPIVAFHEDGMSYVNVAERDVAARYRARGQVNYIPGVWDPCWFSGQLLVYQDDLPCFSMLFEDDGEHFRHVIDFTPLLVPHWQ